MAKRFTTLKDEEIIRIIGQVREYHCADARRPMLRALFLLLANTGLRITEAVRLPWKAVDFERGEVTVETLKQRQTTRGKRAETRQDTLPLDAKTLEALAACRNAAGPTDRIFPISRHVAYNIFQRLQHYACIRPVKLHALRHSAVTRWIEQTGDLTFAQAMARHRSISSTAQYVHCRHLKEQFAKTKPIG